MEKHSVYKAIPGSGPRHIAFSKDRRFVYSVNELDSTVDVLGWDVDAGTLTRLQNIRMLPEGFTEFSKAAEVVVHPSGQFVYASNRGHDSIVCFHVEPGSGRLSVASHTPCGGSEPRHFNIEPNGRYLICANHYGNNVVAFHIDHETGKLTPTGSEVEISQPVCVVFLNN